MHKLNRKKKKTSLSHARVYSNERNKKKMCLALWKRSMYISKHWRHALFHSHKKEIHTTTERGNNSLTQRTYGFCMKFIFFIFRNNVFFFALTVSLLRYVKQRMVPQPRRLYLKHSLDAVQVDSVTLNAELNGSFWKSFFLLYEKKKKHTANNIELRPFIKQPLQRLRQYDLFCRCISIYLSLFVALTSTSNS